MRRAFKHPDTFQIIKVVPQGVDLELRHDQHSEEPVIVVEMDQDQAIDIATAILKRAGIRAVRFHKDATMTVDFYSVHPFTATWDREPVAPENEQPTLSQVENVESKP